MLNCAPGFIERVQRVIDSSESLRKADGDMPFVDFLSDMAKWESKPADCDNCDWMKFDKEFRVSRHCHMFADGPKVGESCSQFQDVMQRDNKTRTIHEQ